MGLLRRHPGKGAKERLPSSRREGKEGKKDDQKRNGLFRRRPVVVAAFSPPPLPPFLMGESQQQQQLLVSQPSSFPQFLINIPRPSNRCNDACFFWKVDHPSFSFLPPFFTPRAQPQRRTKDGMRPEKKVWKMSPFD